MLTTHRREKLINAIVFFATHTRDCGKIKLIKLLYLLDFEHYRQTGRSVTDQEYYAWEMGPVPIEFYQQFDDPPPDHAEAFSIVPRKIYDFFRMEVQPKREFDPAHFTRRELRIMEALAERFRDDQSRPMVNVTHDESGPWSAIWAGGQGRNDRIPYRLAVPATAEHRDEILSAAAEYEGLRAAERAQA